MYIISEIYWIRNCRCCCCCDLFMHANENWVKLALKTSDNDKRYAKGDTVRRGDKAANATKCKCTKKNSMMKLNN